MNHKIATALAALATTAGLALATAGPAAAAVPHVTVANNCLTGPEAGFCGHQTAPDGLTLAVGANLKIVSQLFLTPNTQMIWANNGLPGNAKTAEWAPDGVPQGLCMTQITGGASMTACTPGDLAQEWIFNGTGWANAGTGDVIQDHHYVQGPVSVVSGAFGNPGTPYTFIEG